VWEGWAGVAQLSILVPPDTLGKNQGHSLPPRCRIATTLMDECLLRMLSMHNKSSQEAQKMHHKLVTTSRPSR
jgi:hypothetical protein